MLYNQLDLLGQKYMSTLLDDDRRNEIDHVYGMYFDSDNGIILGDKRFDIDKNDSIIIDNVRYIGTPGIYKLIFKRILDDTLYTEDDKETYKNILLTTNV